MRRYYNYIIYMNTSITNIPTIEKQEIKTKRIDRIINYFMKDQERNKYVNIMGDLLKGYVIGYEYYEKKGTERDDLRRKKGNNQKKINQLNYTIKNRKYILKHLNILINQNIKGIAIIIKKNYTS